MEYRNRGQRCEHGFMQGVISCPVCDSRRWRGKRESRKGEGGHSVYNNKGKKPVREARPSEYITGRARRPT